MGSNALCFDSELRGCSSELNDVARDLESVVRTKVVVFSEHFVPTGPRAMR